MSGPFGGVAVNIGMVPRVERRAPVLDIGAVPRFGIGRACHQRLQPFIGRGVGADIQLVQVQHLPDPLDGLPRDGCACPPKLAQCCRCDQPDQQAKDGDDDKEFDQGETTLTPARGRGAATLP